MILAVRFNARFGDENPYQSRQRRLNKNHANVIVQPSLPRLEDEPRCRRALLVFEN